MSSQVFGENNIETNHFGWALERLLRDPNYNFQSTIGLVDLLGLVWRE